MKMGKYVKTKRKYLINIKIRKIKNYKIIN